MPPLGAASCHDEATARYIEREDMRDLRAHRYAGRRARRSARQSRPAATSARASRHRGSARGSCRAHRPETRDPRPPRHSPVTAESPVGTASALASAHPHRSAASRRAWGREHRAGRRHPPPGRRNWNAPGRPGHTSHRRAARGDTGRQANPSGSLNGPVALKPGPGGPSRLANPGQSLARSVPSAPKTRMTDRVQVAHVERAVAVNGETVRLEVHRLRDVEPAGKRQAHDGRHRHSDRHAPLPAARQPPEPSRRRRPAPLATRAAPARHSRTPRTDGPAEHAPGNRQPQDRPRPRHGRRRRCANCRARAPPPFRSGWRRDPARAVARRRSAGGSVRHKTPPTSATASTNADGK